MIDLTGKSLDEIIMYLKEKGYVPCHDTYGMHIGYLACPNDCSGYCEIDIQIKHEKYDISLFECDCDLVFYEIIYKDLDLMPDRWETKDGIMVGLE